MTNQKIAKILYEIEQLLTIKGVAYKPKAYRKAAKVLESLEKDVADIYQKEGIKGLEKIQSVGKSIAKKIAEFLKKGKIKYKRKSLDLHSLFAQEKGNLWLGNSLFS